MTKSHAYGAKSPPVPAVSTLGHGADGSTTQRVPPAVVVEVPDLAVDILF